MTEERMDDSRQHRFTGESTERQEKAGWKEAALVDRRKHQMTGKKLNDRRQHWLT